MFLFASLQTEPAVQQGRELEELLLQVAAGDRDALGALYHRTRAAVYGLALSYLKRQADAEDVTQNTFLQAWEHAGQYRGTGKALAWLLTIARNLSLMALRRRKDEDLPPEDWAAIPDKPALSLEDRHLLSVVMNTLEEQERPIVLLHAVPGLKHREIAALLELPLSTVLSKYHRSLKKLRQQLEGDETP